MRRTIPLALLLALCGCPQDEPAKTAKTSEAGPTSAPAAAAGEGGASPQDLFTKLKACQRPSGEPDQAALYHLLSKSSKSTMIQGMVQACGGAMMMLKDEAARKAAEAEFDALYAKHGIPKFKPQEARQPPSLEEQLAKVKDRFAFYSDLVAFVRKHMKNMNMAVPTGELTDLKVDGRRATARVKMKMGEKEIEEQVTFVQEDGRWFMELKKP